LITQKRNAKAANFLYNTDFTARLHAKSLVVDPAGVLKEDAKQRVLICASANCHSGRNPSAIRTH
jgi:hypothetical protein